LQLILLLLVSLAQYPDEGIPVSRRIFTNVAASRDLPGAEERSILKLTVIVQQSL